MGEAPGQQEELSGIPFFGSAGQELDRMLEEAGIKRSECYLTNVLFTRPRDNKMEYVSVKKGELSEYPPVSPEVLKTMAVPLSNGRYLHPSLAPELERLYAELRAVKPNLIVLLGNTPSWAVIRRTKISSLRGAICESPFGKCLPTYHPSAVLRDWSIRPIVVADLFKAERERHFPEIRRPSRFVTMAENIEDIEEFYLRARQARFLSVDIETKRRQITAIGFGLSAAESLVVLFYSPRSPDNSFWTRADEVRAWRLVGKILSCPAGKIFQNGLFDLQYLYRMRFRVTNIEHDTMLLSHALYPEMPKGLGFLGSIHTNEAAWKLSRKTEELKKDE